VRGSKQQMHGLGFVILNAVKNLGGVLTASINL
jgi:hypothetical protein